MHNGTTPGAFSTELSQSNSASQPTISGASRGCFIINADDWGCDRETTDRTLGCVGSGNVSSVSAMVFMVDSERAATIALEHEIEVGLHLNFTTPFSGPRAAAALVKHQGKISQFLRQHSLAPAIFHPGLVRSFEYVAKTQRDEFNRLYGTQPMRLDGHHHMHLCANVIFQRLLPPDTIVRRNFSFRAGEKSLGNRMYRRLLDGIVGRHHIIADFFFSLPPLEPATRLKNIFALAQRFIIEIETHPINEEEYRFLMRDELRQWTERRPISPSLAFAGR